MLLHYAASRFPAKASIENRANNLVCRSMVCFASTNKLCMLIRARRAHRAELIGLIRRALKADYPAVLINRNFAKP